MAQEGLDNAHVQALVLAKNRGQVSNSTLRDTSGLDTLAASNILRDLRDRGFLEPRSGGPATYYVLGPRVPTELQSETDPICLDNMNRGEPNIDRGEFTANRGELDIDRGELPETIQPPAPSSISHSQSLPENVMQLLAKLGPKPRKEKLRRAILRLCELRPWKPTDLTEALGLHNSQKLVERHLGPMTNEGLLQRTHPDITNHPEQAYLAVQPSLRNKV